MSNEKRDQKDELDQFWDISRLVPQKPKSPRAPSYSPRKSSPVAIRHQRADSVSKAAEEGRLTVKAEISEPDTPKNETVFAEYSNFSPLLSHVKVSNWKSTYNYYELFCRQAEVIHKKQGPECPEAVYVPFFSYVSQYTQLNRGQFSWYLWWREFVRNGKYVRNDISYINLLIFEIINLGNKIDTKNALDILIGLWENYKDEYPQLNSTLAEWICDYSLINNHPISFPDPRLGTEFYSSVSFPEAFYSFNVKDKALFAKFLLSACCSYHYKKSKFYTDANKEIYDEYVPRAVCDLLEKLDAEALLSKQPKEKVSRMAYTGALCSYKTRKLIEVEYIPLCTSHEVKNQIGDIVKYAENKVRSYLGIRSRLKVRAIDSEAMSALDSFFARSGLSESSVKPPEYERLYEVTESEFSLSSALAIEKQSWEVTDRLVEAFEEEAPNTPIAVEKHPACPIPLSKEPLSEREQFIERISRHAEFFSLVLKNKTKEQSEYILANNLLPEALIDEINEVAVEIFGDILIEEADIGYQIIEEYRSIFE